MDHGINYASPCRAEVLRLTDWSRCRSGLDPVGGHVLETSIAALAYRARQLGGPAGRRTAEWPIQKNARSRFSAERRCPSGPTRIRLIARVAREPARSTTFPWTPRGPATSRAVGLGRVLLSPTPQNRGLILGHERRGS